MIDSHCHLDYEPMCNDLDSIIDRAKENGVSIMLTISTEDKKFQSILISEQNKFHAGYRGRKKTTINICRNSIDGQMELQKCKC